MTDHLQIGEVDHAGVISVVRRTVDRWKYRARWYTLFALNCTLAVVGLLSILSAIIHRLCMPAGITNHAGMDMPG